jgi:RNA polymerase sigma-70 factor, ECF subfamily
LSSPSQDITAILREIDGGDESAAARLMPLVYDELRRLADSYLRRERPDHTLQPTALVNEAYLRLVDQTRARLRDRSHFFAVAARQMRRVLVDHARRHHADKRGGGARRVSLDEAAEHAQAARDLDLVALDAALNRLAELDARQARIVELRFFGGLTVEETARALGVSATTVKDDWQSARAWLRREVRKG